MLLSHVCCLLVLLVTVLAIPEPNPEDLHIHLHGSDEVETASETDIRGEAPKNRMQGMVRRQMIPRFWPTPPEWRLTATPTTYLASRYDTFQKRNISHSNELFSVKLYNLLRKKSQNLVYSPFSISSVMAMLSLGAKKETLWQLKQVFFFPTSDELQNQYKRIIPALRSRDDFTLDTANTIFMNQGFHISTMYKAKVRWIFQSNIYTLNFGHSRNAAMKINSWVEKKTRDKIKNLISPSMLDGAQLVLINAIYFQSDWVNKFTDTQKRKFFVRSSKTVEVPMMMKEETVFYAKLSHLSCSMIEMPYKGKGGRIVMQVLLPDTKNGLKRLEDKLSYLLEDKLKPINEYFEKIKRMELVKIHLPKFKFETNLPLNSPLKQMGLKNLFSNMADFSGISENGRLSISHVVQKAIIEVDEEGTTAAAATAVFGHFMSAYHGPTPIPFVANHPFIFYLRDKESGMLLFQGRVINPLKRN